jgi:sec-independent protein translocase protein TatA
MSFSIFAVLSPWHIVILVAAILLMFGGRKIPELMSGIGKGMKDFKKAIKEDDETPKEITKDYNKKEPLK